MQLRRLDYYKALEVDANASAETIERAYRFCIDNYAEDSVATYGLISDEERREALRYFEEAHRVLCDEARRADYDASLIQAGEYRAEQLQKPAEPAPASPAAEEPRDPEPEEVPGDPVPADVPVEAAASEPLFVPEPSPVVESAAETTAHVAAETPPAEDDAVSSRDRFAENLQSILEEKVLGGAQLRQIRELRGLSVAEVATHTKISMTNIRFIEEEDFTYLPALVYLRGFLRTYARMLRIDADRLLRDYIPRFQQYRAD